MKHFFAYLSRMRLIRRWGLMRNTYEENIQEHSLQVAMIAHGLAIIRNTYFGGIVNPDRVTTLAVYHEAGEVFTGDLATPIKYFNPEIKQAYVAIEDFAKARLQGMLPAALQSVLEIDACLAQARAITRLMGASAPHDTLPPMTMQEASWAVCDMLKRIDTAVGKLGRLASAREA